MQRSVVTLLLIGLLGCNGDESFSLTRIDQLAQTCGPGDRRAWTVWIESDQCQTFGGRFEAFAELWVTNQFPPRDELTVTWATEQSGRGSACGPVFPDDCVEATGGEVTFETVTEDSATGQLSLTLDDGTTFEADFDADLCPAVGECWAE